MTSPPVAAAPPARAPGTEVRLLATNDLLGSVLPLPTTWGEGGSVHGVAQLLEQARESGPALWLDSGDLGVGGPDALFGRAALDDIASLPLAAAAVGNHDLDEGPEALRAAAAGLRFPLLCADRDVGLPGTALIDTPAGVVGVVGITHPFAHELALAPPPREDWRAHVRTLASDLRGQGARWVIALLHDGATWWAVADPTLPLRTRARQLAGTTRGWASQVDLILGGHTFGAWTGTLHGVPVGHAHPYAATVLVIDLPAPPERATVHPPVRVPATRPRQETPATAAIDAARERVVGQVGESWLCRPHAEHYLPHLVARVLRGATGADAAFVPASQLFTQAPLDGTTAALRAGSVTELDVERLFPFSPDDLTIVELRPGELRSLLATHDGGADPANATTDGRHWNWARMPAGVSGASADPESLAVRPFLLPLLSAWLQRSLTTHPCDAGARRALRQEVAAR